MRIACRIVVIAVFVLAASLCVAAQDLGSSNKLFGAPKAKTTTKTPARKTPVKRPVAKTKTTTAKPRPKTATAAKTAKPSPKPEPKKPATQTAKIDTKPVKPPATREPAPPVNAAAAELFERLIEDGNLARDERNYSAAETAYERAKAIKPKDARAVYGLGNIYSDQQRWDDAEAAYRSALELDPSNPIIHVALSYVLSQPLFVSDLGDRYEEAEKLARRAIQLAPSNALAFDQLGVAMELRGLISNETENAYRSAIRLDSTFAPAYAHLGRLLSRRGLANESASAYETALRLSTDVGTMILVAEVMQSEQRVADSEPLLRRAVKEDPRNPSALMLLGRVLTTMGQYAEAERILNRSLEASPSGFMPNLLLGSLYSRQSRYEQAENALLQALRFVSGSEKRRLSQQFEAVGDGYLRSGKAQAAERAYRQAMSLDAERESLSAKLAKARHG